MWRADPPVGFRRRAPRARRAAPGCEGASKRGGGGGAGATCRSGAIPPAWKARFEGSAAPRVRPSAPRRSPGPATGAPSPAPSRTWWGCWPRSSTTPTWPSSPGSPGSQWGASPGASWTGSWTRIASTTSWWTAYRYGQVQLPQAPPLPHRGRRPRPGAGCLGRRGEVRQDCPGLLPRAGARTGPRPPAREHRHVCCLRQGSWILLKRKEKAKLSTIEKVNRTLSTGPTSSRKAS